MSETQSAYHVSVTPAPVFTVASNPTVFGIDVSKWQGSIDYHQCEADGVKFAGCTRFPACEYTAESVPRKKRAATKKKAAKKKTTKKATKKKAAKKATKKKTAKKTSEPTDVEEAPF